MSGNKSIDGLRRRSVSKTASTQATRASSVRKKRILKARSTESENHPRLDREADEKVKDSAEDKAVREFLAEVRDEDPTDLTAIPRKERKEVKKKKKKHGKAKFVVLAILLVIGGLATVAYFFLDDFVKQVTDDGNLWNVVFSDPDVPLAKDENGRTNVLIYGTEGYDMDDPDYDGGFLTDTIMLVSFDQESGVVQAVSLPRDLRFYEYEYRCTATAKLNEVFYCKYSNFSGEDKDSKQLEKEGGEALASAVTMITGQEIHYRVHANWSAVVDIVNAVGGIDIVLLAEGQTWDGPETILEVTDEEGLAEGNDSGYSCYDDRAYYWKLETQTVHHLDGGMALAVARARNHGYCSYGSLGGNFSREAYQQKIIEATMKKAKEMGLDLAKILAIKNAVGDNLRTTFKDTEIKTLLKLSTTLNINNIETVSLIDPSDGSRPLMTTGYVGDISYVLPTDGDGNYSAIQDYIKRKFSNDFSAENAVVVVLNGTQADGVAGREKTSLEDANFYVELADNAPESESGFDGVRVYQINKDKTKTVAELAKRYGVTVKTTIPEDLAGYDCDFIVIIGNGYGNQSEE